MNKFSKQDCDTDDVKHAESMVNDAYQSCENNVYCDFTMRESDMLRYISKLRRGCAPGIDGIASEHLAWAKDTKLIGIIVI